MYAHSASFRIYVGKSRALLSFYVWSTSRDGKFKCVISFGINEPDSPRLIPLRFMSSICAFNFRKIMILVEK